MPSDDLWEGAEIIDAYTRREAIEDGILVQLSGLGYQGDPWIPAIVAEAGFRYPVAMTTTAFCAVPTISPAQPVVNLGHTEQSTGCPIFRAGSLPADCDLQGAVGGRMCGQERRCSQWVGRT